MQKNKKYLAIIWASLTLILISSLLSRLGYAQVNAMPETTPWEYYSVLCGNWDGPHQKESAAIDRALTHYRAECSTLPQIHGLWGTPQEPSIGQPCGSSQRHPLPNDYLFGAERLNMKSVEVETCGGFTVKRERQVSCPDNLVDSNKDCIKTLEQKKDLNQTCELNPISIETGNKTQKVVDYASPRGLSVERIYSSVLGKWTFDFQSSIEQGDYGRLLYLTKRNGELEVFEKQAGIIIAYSDSNSFLTELYDNSNFLGWELQLANGIEQSFDKYGRLLKETNRSGIEVNYGYGSSANVERIGNSVGEELIISWSGNNVIGINAPGQFEFVYEYDLNDNLISKTELVAGVQTSQVIYHYENTNFPNALTGISDESGTRHNTWTYDAQGRANSASNPGGVNSGTIDYSNLEDTVDPRVVFTDILGKQTTYHFQIIAGERKKVLVEGHQSANCAAANKNYTYYSNGLLETKTDWEGNITSYQYNSRNLEISRTEATGTPQERTITTEWHPTFNLRTKITEPGKETIFSYDSQGRLLSQTSNDLPLN